jgi:ABC-type sugar transport system substrate-binding protein
MKKSQRFLSMVVAIVAGASGFSLLAPLSVTADATDLVTICFRNRTIEVPLYLLPRYQAVLGTTLGPCPTSP